MYKYIMYKFIIIFILLLLIILFNQINENFTGFRKCGFLTEFEIDYKLFPFVIHNKKINHNCVNKPFIKFS